MPHCVQMCQNPANATPADVIMLESRKFFKKFVTIA